AMRAEAAVEAGRASDAAFTDLRAQIVAFRSRFQAAQNQGDARLDTLRAQLAALGPAPEEGAPPEAPEIAARRAELTEQIAALEAPRRRAVEAFSRADGIVDEIDRIIRDRQADELLELGPTPLNPLSWTAAWQAQVTSWTALVDSSRAAWANPNVRQEARARAPLILALLFVAAVLIVRARAWIELLARRIEASDGTETTNAAGFVVSVGQVIVPILGLVALAQALELSQLYGVRGRVLLELLPLWGVMIFGARWLGARLFPGHGEVKTPLNIGRQRQWEARRWVPILGVLLVVNTILQGFQDVDRYDDAQHAVLAFPLILVAGLVLLRLGRILRGHAPTLDEDGTLRPVVFDRVIRSIATVISIVAVAAPVLAGIGYMNLAEYMIWPTILSLGLFGLLILLQEFAAELYAVVTRRGAEAKETLIPTLIAFVLALASIPLFALIWGARATDLAEAWTTFQGGFAIGETRIQPSTFLVLMLVFAVGYAITRFLQGALKTSVLPKTQIDQGGQNAITAGVGYVGVFLAALVAISSAGLDLSSLAIVAGALSVGIGFGLQTIVSNFVSGIILLIERPIAEGDWIEVGGQMGFVRDISVRSTRIETFDRTDVIVPNADLVSGTVTNYTRGNNVGRAVLPVGVAYGTDTRKVEAILREIIEAQPAVVLEPPPLVVFMGFGADSLDFEVRAILRDVFLKIPTSNEFNHAVAERFAAEGIEIPFAQRDIWIRNPEVLSKAPPARPSESDIDPDAPMIEEPSDA
ncbi:MAG: DUF3772 domain-containing protein, partial [Shimia sp.]